MYFPDLLLEYKQLLKDMKADGVTSGELYNEVKQAIQWMETGYDPAEHKKKLRVDAFPLDPQKMQEFVAYTNGDVLLPDNIMTLVKSDCRSEIVNEEIRRVQAIRKKVNFALQDLTESERAIFIAIRAERMTFSKVAAMMGITKSTVQGYLSRAEKKIQKNKEKGQVAEEIHLIS